MIKRLAIAVCAAATLLALSSGDGRDRSSRPAALTGSATAGGAVVTATLVTDSSSSTMLRVTIAPLSPGYHIYSLVLPTGGVDGLGVPTRIDVAGAFTTIGQPTTTSTTQYLRIAGLDVALPVYPDGPVTIAVPVARRGYGLTEAIASYGLCSDSRCMMPVEGLDIPLGSN
jgi:hypothetical protein